jgi:hypothetical protein
MMMRKNIIILLAFVSSAVYAQFGKVGTAGLQFLEIGVGARAMGMGRAYNAVGKDVGALYWNPGGAANVKGIESMASHTQYFGGILHDAVGYVQNIKGIGNIGILFSWLHSGKMKVTTVYQYEGTGETFAYYAFQLGAHYSKFLTDRFAFGVNLKFMMEDFGTVDELKGRKIQSKCGALDIGTFYYTGFKSLRIGISILNFGPDVTPSGKYLSFEDDLITPRDTLNFTPYPLPMVLRFGIAMEVWETKNSELTLAIDAIHPNDNLERMAIGTEYIFNKMFFLRGGCEIGKDDGGYFSGGCGFVVGKLKLDYSFSDRGCLPDVSRITIGVSL